MLPAAVRDLPLHAQLPAIRAALAGSTSLVLQAEPGAGKSTLVPLALLDEPWAAGQRILMLQPRRLAARALATRIANLLGQSPGQTVGYRVSLDTRVGPTTRLEILTEGVLTRMIQDDPDLEGVAAVIFDEFHERNLQGDLGLAFCLEARDTLRSDLRLVVMSATMDSAAVAAVLGGGQAAGHSVTAEDLAGPPPPTDATPALRPGQDKYLPPGQSPDGHAHQAEAPAPPVGPTSLDVGRAAASHAGPVPGPGGHQIAVPISSRPTAGLSAADSLAVAAPDAGALPRYDGLGPRAVPFVTGGNSPYPVTVEWLPPPNGSSFWQHVPRFCTWVADTLADLRSRQTGDILVFLPGRREIDLVCRALLTTPGFSDGPVSLDTQLSTSPLPASSGASTQVWPLHGSVPTPVQDAILRPSIQARIILATSLAETSLTIPGVRAVVDTGIARFERFDPGIGLDRLVSERVSLFSARQRTGRAGRLGPGHCVRLWPQDEVLAPALPPDLERTDLSPLVLEAAVWGAATPTALRLISPIPSQAWNRAALVLEELGLVTVEVEGGHILQSEVVPAAHHDAPGTRDTVSLESITAGISVSASTSPVSGPSGHHLALVVRVTPLGTRVARLGTSPRLGRLLLDGASIGADASPGVPGAVSHCGLASATLLAACLDDSSTWAGQSLDVADHLAQFAHDASRHPGSDPFAQRSLSLYRRALAALGHANVGQSAAENLASAPRPGQFATTWHQLWSQADLSLLPDLLASAFPDRIGRLISPDDSSANPKPLSRQPGQIYQLVSGRQALLPAGPRPGTNPGSDSSAPTWIIVTEADAGNTRSTIRTYLTLPPGIEAKLRTRASEYLDCSWKGLVPQVRRVLALGDLIFSTSPLDGRDPRRIPRITTSFLARLDREGPDLLPWTGYSRNYLSRLAFAVRQGLTLDLPNSDTSPGTGTPDSTLLAILLSRVDYWLVPYFNHRPGSPVLDSHGLDQALDSLVPHRHRADLDRLAPIRLTLPSGKTRNLEYPDDPAGQPVLSLRIQEAFGIRNHPRAGTTPVLLHLLSPAGRPLQITSDLQGFWDGSWKDVRKDMRGRYPKHHWPDDPRLPLD